MSTSARRRWRLQPPPAWVGRPRSEEHRRALSLAMQGRKGHSSPWKGKKLSAGHRRAISEGQRGRVAWNKGTYWKMSPEGRAKISKALKGRTFTLIHRKNISRARCQGLALGTIRPPYQKNRWKSHYRVDLGKRFRSRWEANFARILNASSIAWEYEPRAFVRPDGKSYLPDFYLPILDGYVEIKGWSSPSWQKDFDLRRKAIPGERLFVIDKYCYEELAAAYQKRTQHWEGDHNE